MSVQEQIQQSRQQIESQRQQLELAKKSIPKVSTGQLLRQKGVQALQQMLMEKSKQKPLKQIAKARGELGQAEVEFEKEVAIKAPEYGKAEYTEPLIQQAKTEVQKRIDDLNARIKKREEYIVRKREDRSDKDRSKDIDRAEDDISVYRAELNEYQKGIGLSAVDLIKQHFSGYLREKAQYEADYRQARNDQQNQFNEMKNKPEFKEDLAKLGLDKKAYVSLSDYEGAVKKFNQNVAYEQNLVNWATKAGFDKLPESIQQTMKDRGLVTFDEQRFSTEGKTLVTEPQEVGSLILTQSQADKITGPILSSSGQSVVGQRELPSYVKVIPDNMTSEQMIQEFSYERGPYIISKPAGGLGTDYYLREPTPTKDFEGPIILGGEIPEGVVPEWYESKITPNKIERFYSAEGKYGNIKTFDIEGYEPIRLTNEFQTGQQIPLLKQKIGAGKELISEGIVQPIFRMGQDIYQTAVLGAKEIDVDIRKGVGLATQKIEGLTGWDIPTPDLQAFKRQVAKGTELTLRDIEGSPFFQGIDKNLAQTFVRESGKLGVGLGVEAGRWIEQPFSRPTELYIKYKSGKAVGSIFGIGLGLGQAGASYVSPYLGKAVKAGMFGIGAYSGTKVFAPMAINYFGEKDITKAGEYFSDVLVPTGAMLAGFSRGTKKGQEYSKYFTTRTYDSQKVGVREYRKIFNYGPQKDVKLTQAGRRVVVQRSPIERFFGRTDTVYQGIYGQDRAGYQSALKWATRVEGYGMDPAKQLIAFRKPTFKPVDVTPTLSKSLSLGKPTLLGSDKGVSYFKTSVRQKVYYKTDPFRPKVKEIKTSADLIVGQKEVGGKIKTVSFGTFEGPKVLRLFKGERVFIRDVGKIKGRMDFKPFESRLFKGFKGKGDFYTKEAGKVIRVKGFKGPLRPTLIKTRLPTEAKSDITSLVKIGKTRTVDKLINGRIVKFDISKSSSFSRTKLFPKTIKIKGYTAPGGTKVSPYLRKSISAGEKYKYGFGKDITIKRVSGGEGEITSQFGGGRGTKLITKPSQVFIKETTKLTSEVIKGKIIRDIPPVKVTTLKTISSPKVTTKIIPITRQEIRQSVYTGTEQYKRKEVDIIKKVKPIQISALGTLSLATMSLVSLNKIGQKQKMSQVMIPITKIESTQKTAQIRVSTFAKVLAQRQKMAQTQISRTQQVTAMTPITIKTPKPTRPTIPLKLKQKIPKIPIPSFDFESLEKQRRRKQREGDKAFTVELRRRGKFLQTGVALSKEEAIAFGASKTLGGAGATFRLKETKQPRRSFGLALPGRFLDLFRPSKSKRETPLTFVQRREKRILTPGEKREISQLGGRPRKSERRSR